jgi:hypothetical protein
VLLSTFLISSSQFADYVFSDGGFSTKRAIQVLCKKSFGFGNSQNTALLNFAIETAQHYLKFFLSFSFDLDQD